VLDGDSCELKHVALRYVMYDCCVGLWILVLCDTETHRGVSE